MKATIRRTKLLWMGFLVYIGIVFVGSPMRVYASGYGSETITEPVKTIPVIYGVITVLSFVLAIGYCILIRQKEKWLIYLHFATSLVNLGYFMLSVSKTLDKALCANRIAYLGAVFLPMFMLMAICNACQIKYRKWVPCILLLISFVMFGIAASPGYSACYYKEVSLVLVDGVVKLEKVYGPLHNLNFFYLFSYFVAMIGIIAFSVIRRKITVWNHVAILAVVALLNIMIWFVEQFIYWHYEFLSVSYIVSELLLLFVYRMQEDYGLLESKVAVSGKTSGSFDLEQIADYWPEIRTLSPREREVLEKMVEEKKRKEIAEELCITENTVKKHVSNIFDKLQVSSRSELLEKLK